MRVISCKDRRSVPVGTIPDGVTFEWNGRYYIRPVKDVRVRAGILGVNLETGGCIYCVNYNDDSLMVRPVEMEACEV